MIRPLRVLFCGTPKVAVPFLSALAGCQRTCEVVGILTNPDAAVGRGLHENSPPVKQEALRFQYPVLQPRTLSRNQALVAQVTQLQPDLGFVVAYGKLIPPEMLAVPRLGFLNVHFSLLPKYRGAAPIQWAIANRETKSGVSFFWLEPSLDTGPILLQKELAIEPEETAVSLSKRLTDLGVSQVAQALELCSGETPPRIPQEGSPTLAPTLDKSSGEVDWTLPADEILARFRAFHPWPGLFTWVEIEGRRTRLKLIELAAFGAGQNAVYEARPGTVVCLERGIGPVVKCGQNFLLLRKVIPEGKREMGGWDFWQGARLSTGVRLA